MRDQDPDAVNYYRLHFLDGEGGCTCQGRCSGVRLQLTMGNRGSIFSKTDDGGDQSVSKWGWTSYYKVVSLKRRLSEGSRRFHNHGEGSSRG